MSLYSRLDRIAADVARLDRQLTSVSNHPQSQRTSVEGGSIDFNDDDGNLMAIVGSQDDGGNTINVISGPTPPTPVGFTVAVDHGKFIVHWSGDFDGDKLAPSDWSRAEVHASQDPFFVPDRTTARGSIVSAAGGEVTIGVLKGPWTIKMLAWSQAGKMSAPSAPVDVEVPGYGDIVLEEIDAATTLIKNAGEMLLEGQQTLADKLAGIADLDPEEISEEIAQARQEAIDAALAEIANVEGTLTSAIGGKSTTTWSTSNPPVNYDGAVGDTWVKLTSLGSGGREIRRSRWQGDVWVDHPVDGAVLANVDASTITTGFLDVVNRIRTGAILADKLLIGGDRNLIPNGDLSIGSSAGWPANAEFAATGGPNNAPMVTFPAGSYVYNPFAGTRFPVTPGETLVFEAWIKADTPNSVLFVTFQNQSGPNTSTAGRLVNWKETVGEANQSQGPISGFTVPTTWTKKSSRITVPAGVESVVAQAFYLNHSSGTNTSARVSFSGMKLYKPVGGTLIEPGGIQTPHLAADVLEVGNLKAGTAALAEAVIKKLFAEVVVARMAQAEEFIGENALLTNSVTAPKIVASEELWAKLGQFVKIRSEHIESDALDFMVARGGTYLTSGGNGSWSDNGLFISGPDGTSLVRFPTDGSPLSLTASDVQIDRASIGELDITQQTVRSGGTVTLASGVTAPASPPELTTEWKRYTTLTRPEIDTGYSWVGLAAWGDKWVRAINVYDTYSGEDNEDFIVVYNADGEVEKTISIDLNPRHGVAVIGDVAYVLGPDRVPRPGPEQAWVHGFNLNTGARVSRFNFPGLDANRRTGLGATSDGMLINATVSTAGNSIVVRVRNPQTGVEDPARAWSTDWPTSATKNVEGVSINGDMLYVHTFDYARSYRINGSTLTRIEGAGWAQPLRNATGATLVGSVPYVVTGSGDLHEGSQFSADTTTMHVCFTWWNGTHETTPSPVASSIVAAREALTVSLPKRTGLQKRVYLRKGATGAWSRFNVGENTTVFVDSTGATGLYQLPTSNTFPASTPAVLKSGVGNLVFRGDGSGRIGPLTFNPDGTMTGLPLIAAGTVVNGSIAKGGNSVFTVNFPPGRFASPPVVTYITASPRIIPAVDQVTATSFRVRMYNLTDATADDTTVSWIAIGGA